MPPSSQSFTALNSPCDPTLPESMDYFTLQAPPNTDLWRKPPAHDTCTSPILYTRLSHPFVAAEVTVSADWEMEWDQGGLVIFGGRPPGTPTLLPQPRPSTAPAPASVSEVGHAPNAPPPPYIRPPPASKWVKAGLEFCNGHPHASSVSATTDGADWAMSPLPLPPSPSSPST
ncbi:MAG: hypothetical protein M1830_005322, partial [Pleopsidium flavum]